MKAGPEKSFDTGAELGAAEDLAALSTSAAALLRAGFEVISEEIGLFRKERTYCRLDESTDTAVVFTRLPWASPERMGKVSAIDAGTKPGETYPRFLLQLEEPRGGRAMYEGYAESKDLFRVPAAALPRSLEGLGLEAQLKACGALYFGTDSSGRSIYGLEAGEDTMERAFLFEMDGSGKLEAIYKAAKLGNSGMKLEEARAYTYTDTSDGEHEVKNACIMTFESDLHRMTVHIYATSCVASRSTIREPTLEEIGVAPAEPRRDRAGGIWIGGANESLNLQELCELDGEPIEALEAKARKCGIGLLGPEERLPPLLAADNDTVIEAGFGHAQLAWPLRLALGRALIDCNKMSYNGHEFELGWKKLGEEQIDSGFGGISSNLLLRILNCTTREEMEVWAALPELIEAYGFYGGRECGPQAVRVEPLRIAEFFMMEPEAK